MDSKRRSKLYETMAKKLADTTEQNTILLSKLQEKDEEVSLLSKLLQAKKDGGKRPVEPVKAHLQGQLHRKEAENNRLSVQIKNLKETVEQQKGEINRLREELRRSKTQDVRHETSARAAEVYRRRAERSEEVTAHVRSQLQDTEKKCADALAAAETWQHRHVKAREENDQLQVQVSLLTRQISELTEKLNSVQVKVQPPAVTEATDLSETVRCLEKQLKKSRFRERILETRGTCLDRTLAELRIKHENQTAQVELLVTRNKMSLEENRQLHQQLENLKRSSSSKAADRLEGRV